jgi:predicted NodU family carbamoyl transferase
MNLAREHLGNRSILANPKNKNMKKILNKKIKYREGP